MPGRRRMGGPRHRPDYVSQSARYDASIPGTVYRPRPLWQLLALGIGWLIGLLIVVAMIIVIAEGAGR